MSLLAPSSAVGMASFCQPKPVACRRSTPTLSARTPVAKEPLVAGLPVAQWPQRVAVIAYGRYADYGQGNLIMAGGTPNHVAHWACANGVRTPK